MFSLTVDFKLVQKAYLKQTYWFIQQFDGSYAVWGILNISEHVDSIRTFIFIFVRLLFGAFWNHIVCRWNNLFSSFIESFFCPSLFNRRNVCFWFWNLLYVKVWGSLRHNIKLNTSSCRSPFKSASSIKTFYFFLFYLFEYWSSFYINVSYIGGLQERNTV